MSQAGQLAGTFTNETDDAAFEPTPVTSNGMARNAIIVSVTYILSRVIGMLRDMILANHFGTSRDMDAYVAAFRIPDLLFLTIMSGAFGAAFIPVFGTYIDQGRRDKAGRLASAILSWTGIFVLVSGAVCWVLASPLVKLIAPGYDAYTYRLATDLMRILLLSPLFLGFAIAGKGILEAQNQFTLPALGPIVYNLAIIGGAIFLVDDYGITGIAWCVILGAFLYLLVEVPGIIRSELRLRPLFSRSVAGLSEVATLLGPRILGLAAFQINFIAVTAFASTLDAGQASALNYAWQLLMLPHGILALSISTVAFPPLAAAYGRGDKVAFARILDTTMRPLLFLSIPASVGLAMLGKEIVQVIYQRGEFTDRSTEIVSHALFWFAIGLVGYGLTEIITRVFYATRDTRTPVATTVLTILLNIVLCALLIESSGVRGLTFAMSATTACEAFILLIFLRTRSGRIFESGFFGWLMKVVAASIAMGAVISITRPWLDDVLSSQTSLVMHLAYFGACFVAYLLAFISVAWMLRIPELDATIGKVTNRLPAFRRR